MTQYTTYEHDFFEDRAFSYSWENVGRKIGISPKELLSLPSNSRKSSTAGSRRFDVLEAFRRRRHDQDHGECRRREAHDGRSSDEIFTGMLVRSRHDARVSAGGRDEGATLDRPCIALLLAGCQQPAVQRLYSVDEVGLGQAMKMTEDVSVRESDSDDEVTASFEAPLAKEGRRWVPETTSSFPSFSSLSLSRREQTPSLRCRRVPCARKKPLAKKEDSARSVGDSKSSCDHPPAAAPSTIVKEDRVESLPMPCPASSSSNGERDRPTVEGAGYVKIQKCPTRSEGVQCSGPPVDQGVQTSDLRLPRSNRWTHRVLEARSPISPKDLPRPKTLSVNGDPGKSGLSQAGKVVVEATRNGTCTSETSLKPMIMCSMGEHALSRNSARQGLGGIRDADQGRRILPVRTMASGQVSPDPGPIVLLPLGGEMERVQRWHHAGKYAITPRKFLRVLDWVDDRESFVSKNVERGDASAMLPSAANNSLSTHTRESKGFTLGDGPAVREDGERGELGGCEDPLNLVWKGVGSLSEQLAEVDTFFEKLEQDMDHDREVVEAYHREALDEIEVAARDLRNVRSRRVSSHPAYGLEAAEVSYWRSRMETFDNAVPRRDATGEDATERESQGRQHHSDSSIEDHGASKGPAAQEAASAAEDDLREARTILESIEQEMAAATASVTTARSSR